MTRRWHWGLGIALVYCVFAAGTVGFVAFAMRQPVDLVSADYYAQSLAHDVRMAATARADALGETFSMVVDAAEKRLVISWPPRTRLEAGDVVLYRASDAREDQRVAATPDERGHQSIPTDALERGLWIVRVSWIAEGRSFFAERRVMLP